MPGAITVSQLNSYVKNVLQEDDALQMLTVCGEISNFTKHFKTGHFYFSLKDESCTVKAVMFRSDAQYTGFLPENGMKVIVYARASLFERDGSFQLYAVRLIPDGVGEMQLALEQLKKKLQAQGLFAQEHKKPLPQAPQTVGLVTSKTGAALQDILNVAARRCPTVQLVLAPVCVQGAGAAQEIARAIERLDAAGCCDVMIVARGGGSREDLWVFHDERIARAAYACRTPLVSAVGHEIDTCVLDLTADLRAPTPSAAAELVLPNAAERMAVLRAELLTVRARLCARIEQSRQLLNVYRQGSLMQAVCHKQQTAQRHTEHMRKQIYVQMHRTLEREQQRIQKLAALAHSVSPYEVLARGYAVIERDGRAVQRAQQLRVGDRIQIKMHDAGVWCTVAQTVPKEEQK